jgi:hypothetical protein
MVCDHSVLPYIFVLRRETVLTNSPFSIRRPDKSKRPENSLQAIQRCSVGIANFFDHSGVLDKIKWR